VIDGELRASSEEIGEGLCALVGLEAVLLVDPNPGQLLPLPRQLVATPRQRLLGPEQPQLGSDRRCPLSPRRSRGGTPCRSDPRAAPAAAAPARRYAASAPSRPGATPAGPPATLHVFRSYERSLFFLLVVTTGWRGPRHR